MNRPVLSVASECAPLVKTGGLADVAGALPAAMAGQGWRLRTLLPGYPAVMPAIGRAFDLLLERSIGAGPLALALNRTPPDPPQSPLLVLPRDQDWVALQNICQS